MSRTTFAAWRCAVIAAAALLSAGCGGGVVDEEHAHAAFPDIRVRTPLVDDDGWPMPVDPPPAHAAESAAAR